VSRTAKCRTVAGLFNARSTAHVPTSSANERLLLELLKVRKLPLEATHGRKIEAVVLLLQRHDQRQIEQCAHASLRTVQRWARQARRHGAASLRSRACKHQTSKLNDQQRSRLTHDLKATPTSLGYSQPNWTAALLLRHIRKNYVATFSLRHCRRLLTTFGTAKRSVQAAARRPPTLVQRTTRSHQVPVVAQPIGDYARQRQALARIKRLASSGMPLQPFAYTLFDIIHDAIPHDEASPGLTAFSGESFQWVIRDFDYSRWLPQMQKYLLNVSSEISGFRPPSLLPQNPRTVLRHEEIVCPNYYRSEGYNEFFRWMGMHHGLVTLLRDEQASFLGYYPIFRSEKMKPFSRDNASFLQAAAPAIAEGIRTAGLVAFEAAPSDAFEPFERTPLAIIVMDRAGKALSLNSAAQSLFHQFAMYDGLETGLSNRGEISAALCYVARLLQAIFGNRDETSIEAGQPVVRIYSHRSGATLRLRGFASDLGENGGHLTVLIELGETAALQRQRLSARYQLSRRQADIMMLLRSGANNKQIAERLATSRSALKSSLRELRLKLDLSDRSSLREVAAARSLASRSS
jgi:transposase/DNA-binding NarL/FixJ family response regulator